MDRLYFQVPFNDKDIAKRSGARFDGDTKCWYAPDEQVANLLRKSFKEVENPAPITELPGEDREFGGNGLFVDLVPSSCWFTNVRYCIEDDDWARLSKGVRARAGQECEVCKGTVDAESGIFLEAHERWHFDEESGTQVLKRIICLCTACHRTTHYGLAQINGEADQVRAHFMAVNDCDEAELDRHVAHAFDTWQERNSRDWALDLSIITNAGITLRRRVAKDDRRNIAHAETQATRAVEASETLTIKEISLDDMDDLFRGF
ncbi:DUF5710 domain-containing protein [Novilysobacter arseniciresistens]|uniref:DUF5710 domain-containing protein n=1 Tax=Novilysobacter arseniciresistens TaxID=1385522 RepID=UPI00068C0AA9|nr:DUF5710 domain-containing protein [Lysobacter arseniciresistens]